MTTPGSGGEVYTMTWSLQRVPVDLAAQLLAGLELAARPAGYSAVFREETGFGTVYFEARNDDASGITCPDCGRTSYHPDDMREGYCGLCHDWTGPKG